jgi:hypothetical protein
LSEDGPVFFTIDSENEEERFKKVVDCFIHEADDNDDYIVYALSVKDKQEVILFRKNVPEPAD